MLLHELLVGRRPTGGTPPRLQGWTTPASAAPVTRPSLVALGSGGTDAPGAAEAAARCAAVRRLTPKRLSRLLRGDLDAIVLKALRPEPERRYATAGLLAEGLARYLDGRPVRARPDSVAYRGGKFLRRHALALATATGVFLLVLGFAIGMRRQASRTAIERDRAEQVTAFLVDLFKSSDPASTRGDTVTVGTVLERGAVRVRAELGDQPVVQAALMEAIGEVYGNLGLLEPAAEQIEQALAVRRSRRQGADRELAATLRLLALVRSEAGQFEAAAPLLAEALERLRRERREPRTMRRGSPTSASAGRRRASSTWPSRSCSRPSPRSTGFRSRRSKSEGRSPTSATSGSLAVMPTRPRRSSGGRSTSGSGSEEPTSCRSPTASKPWPRSWRARVR